MWPNTGYLMALSTVIFFTIACSQQTASTGETSTTPLSTPTHSPTTAPIYQNQPIPEGVTVDKVVVSKSEHLMWVFDGSRLLKSYEIAIGSGGAGPKVYEGDKHTPEGVYRIDSRHPSENYQLFLHISYPNEADRARYEKAKARGEVPEGAGVGFAIGIHGTPDGVDILPHKWVDWTAGCIAVDNDEIRELYRVVDSDGADIEILP
jgi:murein L,D-transpeptidase YafK